MKQMEPKDQQNQEGTNKHTDDYTTDDIDNDVIPSAKRLGYDEDNTDLSLDTPLSRYSDIGHPIELTVNPFSTSSTTATIIVETSIPSYIWCTGVPTDSSVDWMRVMNTAQPIYVNGPTPVLVTNLKPNLDYNIHCNNRNSPEVYTFIHTTKRTFSSSSLSIATVMIRKLRLDRQNHLSFTLSSDIAAAASCRIFNNDS